MTLGLTHPLTEMSTRNLPGGKGWPAHEADNVSANCLENVGASTSQPYGPTWPVIGIPLPLPYVRMVFVQDCVKW
jgi:hypothetical protein